MLDTSPCISILFGYHSVEFLRFSAATSQKLAKANQQPTTASLDLSHEGLENEEAVLKFEGEGGECHFRLQSVDNDLTEIEQCAFYCLRYMQLLLRPVVLLCPGATDPKEYVTSCKAKRLLVCVVSFFPVSIFFQ